MEDKLKKLLLNAYAPYSNYKVSAILVTNDNQEFYGVNVENASYGATICAERVAINSAIAYGYAKKDFAKLYIMNSGNKLGIPCMICRQTFVELLPDDIEIIMYNDSLDKKTYTKVELCPLPFSKGDLE